MRAELYREVEPVKQEAVELGANDASSHVDGLSEPDQPPTRAHHVPLRENKWIYAPCLRMFKQAQLAHAMGCVCVRLSVTLVNCG